MADAIVLPQNPPISLQTRFLRLIPGVALLAVITLRKVVAVVRRRSCRKRGGGVVVGESALFELPDSDAEGLHQFLDDAPSPEIAAQVAEDLSRLMEVLGDDTLRAIARMKMEEYGTIEIAARLGVSVRTVDRKLCLIREIWEDHAGREI